jgi:hypothetical protein
MDATLMITADNLFFALFILVILLSVSYFLYEMFTVRIERNVSIPHVVRYFIRIGFQDYRLVNGRVHRVESSFLADEPEELPAYLRANLPSQFTEVSMSGESLHEYVTRLIMKFEHSDRTQSKVWLRRNWK